MVQKNLKREQRDYKKNYHEQKPYIELQGLELIGEKQRQNTYSLSSDKIQKILEIQNKIKTKDQEMQPNTKYKDESIANSDKIIYKFKEHIKDDFKESYNEHQGRQAQNKIEQPNKYNETRAVKQKLREESLPLSDNRISISPQKIDNFKSYDSPLASSLPGLDSQLSAYPKSTYISGKTIINNINFPLSPTRGSPVKLLAVNNSVIPLRSISPTPQSPTIEIYAYNPITNPIPNYCQNPYISSQKLPVLKKRNSVQEISRNQLPDTLRESLTYVKRTIPTVEEGDSESTTKVEGDSNKSVRMCTNLQNQSKVGYEYKNLDVQTKQIKQLTFSTLDSRSQSVVASREKLRIKSDGKSLRDKALNEIRMNPPLMYLSNSEREALLKESSVCKVEESEIITLINDKENLDAFFIIEGEANAFDETGFVELLPKGTFFGIDGFIFEKRFYSIKAGSNLILMRIPLSVLPKYLKKDSKLTLNIARSLILKQNIFEELNNFKNYIRQFKSGAAFDRDSLIKYYQAMNSSLHPLCNSDKIDFDAWLYSIRRLPVNITSIFNFHLTTKCPELLLYPEVSTPVKSTSRVRQILQTMPGKCIIILRDFETDLFDLVSNLCIHIVESQKILKRLKSPSMFKDLFAYKSDQSKVLDILRTGELTKVEVQGLSRIWPENLGENIANILTHYNNFSMTILSPLSHQKLDATEAWLKMLWLSTVELLGLPKDISCDSISDNEMTVDIIQGSRRAFTNMLSPFMFRYRSKIEKWAKENNPKIVTKHFNCEEDRLYAKAHHFFESRSELIKLKSQLEKENGVCRLDQTDKTGVSITLVNCSKLKKADCDPALAPKAVTKYHVIVNIGYTFGVQSSDIIRVLMNLFGRKIKTINIIGKAGGLTGQKGDLLLTTRIHSDETFEVMENNLGNINVDLLEMKAKRKVHVGPMLTVAGTIMQNQNLLNYYKKLCHCVGLEMEGLYFAREIKRYKELGIIRDDIISRFAYYISDLPLDSHNTLSKEEGEVSFDEGIPSLNAIYRVFTESLFEADPKK